MATVYPSMGLSMKFSMSSVCSGVSWLRSFLPRIKIHFRSVLPDGKPPFSGGKGVKWVVKSVGFKLNYREPADLT